MTSIYDHDHKGPLFFMKGPLREIYIKLSYSTFHYVVTPPLCILIDWC